MAKPGPKNWDKLGSKDLIAFLDSLKTGMTITDYDLFYFRQIRGNLVGRLTAGRPKMHKNDKARWRYHNAKRKAERAKASAEKKSARAIDTGDKVN